MPKRFFDSPLSPPDAAVLLADPVVLPVDPVVLPDVAPVFFGGSPFFMHPPPVADVHDLRHCPMPNVGVRRFASRRRHDRRRARHVRDQPIPWHHLRPSPCPGESNSAAAIVAVGIYRQNAKRSGGLSAALIHDA
jgi:hypothetical protein